MLNFLSIVKCGSEDGILIVDKSEKQLPLVQAGNRRGSTSRSRSRPNQEINSHKLLLCSLNI